MDPRGNSIKKEHFNPFSWEVPHLPAFKEWGKSARRAAALARKERHYEVAVRYTNNAPELPHILYELASRQINWKLIADDEAVPEDVQLVLSCSHARWPVGEEKYRVFNWNIAKLLERLSDKYQLNGTVCYDDGTLVNDVFVRRYKDNTLLVVDMSGRNRELVLHRNGQQIKFTLTRFGFIEFPGWKLEFDNSHTQRLEFDSGQRAVVTFTSPQKLALALRDYAGTAEVEVDGKLITPTQPCSGLPASYNNLYQLADLGELAAGVHTFVLKNKVEDFGFLPAAILLGGADLPAYAGRIIQSANVFIPANALKIKTSHNTPSGDVELIVNGKSLGICLTAPYEWIIPEALRNEVVEIKFSYSSSIAALYGKPWRGSDDLSCALNNLFAPTYRGKPQTLEITFE